MITKNKSGDLLLGSGTKGYLIGDNTLSQNFRDLTEKALAYRQERSITLPITAQLSALVLEQLTIQPLAEVKALLRDWKLKEAAQKFHESCSYPELSESQKILQQLADHLITYVCEEHSLCVRADLKRGNIHGPRDAFEFQILGQKKAEVIKSIHGLTSKVAEILEKDDADDDKVMSMLSDIAGTEVDRWESRFFQEFNEKEFELAACAVLLLEKLRSGMKNADLGSNVEGLRAMHNCH